MKIYTMTEVKDKCRENGYKFCALEDANGDRKQPFNSTKVTITKQLEVIKTRLKNDLLENGIYYVCLSPTISRNNNPDRYPISKGKVINLPVAQNNNPVVYSQAENVLSWKQALEYQNEISELKTALSIANYEKNTFKNRVAELEAKIASEGLHEGTEEEEPDNTTKAVGWLKEAVKDLVPVADRYFDLQEKKLNLEELKINKGKTTGTEKKKVTETGTMRKMIKIGSQEHLNLIEKYYKEDENDKMNLELDKLEAKEPKLYANVMEVLGLSNEEEEPEETEVEESEAENE